MDKATGLIGLLGEDNQKKIKDKVTDFIINAIQDDIEEYNRQTYIFNPDEVLEFANECKEEAFKKVKEDVVNGMVEKLKSQLDLK